MTSPPRTPDPGGLRCQTPGCGHTANLHGFRAGTPPGACHTTGCDCAEFTPWRAPTVTGDLDPLLLLAQIADVTAYTGDSLAGLPAHVERTCGRAYVSGYRAGHAAPPEPP